MIFNLRLQGKLNSTETRDWLNGNYVRLYCDLGLMRVDGKAYAILIEHLHTSTIVRTPKKPDTVTVFHGNS